VRKRHAKRASAMERRGVPRVDQTAFAGDRAMLFAVAALAFLVALAAALRPA